MHGCPLPHVFYGMSVFSFCSMRRVGDVLHLTALVKVWRQDSYPHPQSTYIYRAPQCMSPRRNWDSPTPLAAGECSLPPGPKGGGAHSPAAKGIGESQFRRLEKKLSTLPTLCPHHMLNSAPTTPPQKLWTEITTCLPPH